MDQLKNNTQVKAQSISLSNLIKGRRALLATFIGIMAGMALLLTFFLLMGVPVFREPILIFVFIAIFGVAIVPLGTAWVKLGVEFRKLNN